jgi:hypothetical protein
VAVVNSFKPTVVDTFKGFAEATVTAEFTPSMEFKLDSEPEVLVVGILEPAKPEA